MNSDSGSWQSQFSQGFNAPGDLMIGLLTIAGITATALIVWFLFDRYRRYRLKHPKPVKLSSSPVSPSPTTDEINPLQQMVIYEIIDEFRKQDPAGQASSIAVLEKYSEFLIHNIGRLRANRRGAKEFVTKHYPLQTGYNVELDFNDSGTPVSIKSKVTDTYGRNIEVAFEGPTEAFIKKGTPLLVNYSVGRHFLQGSSRVASSRRLKSLVLSRPEKITLTRERRYARVPIHPATATLQDSGTDLPAKVLDLSLEGVRVQIEKPLEKRRIYQLSFETDSSSKHWSFGPIDCVSSKAFTTGSGGLEGGLTFLYLDANAKVKLSALIKEMVQEFQAKAIRA